VQNLTKVPEFADGENKIPRKEGESKRWIFIEETDTDIESYKRNLKASDGNDPQDNLVSRSHSAKIHSSI
jgi:hypothetical protein